MKDSVYWNRIWATDSRMDGVDRPKMSQAIQIRPTIGDIGSELNSDQIIHGSKYWIRLKTWSQIIDEEIKCCSWRRRGGGRRRSPEIAEVQITTVLAGKEMTHLHHDLLAQETINNKIFLENHAVLAPSSTTWTVILHYSESESSMFYETIRSTSRATCSKFHGRTAIFPDRTTQSKCDLFARYMELIERRSSPFLLLLEFNISMAE